MMNRKHRTKEIYNRFSISYLSNFLIFIQNRGEEKNTTSTTIVI